MHTNSKLSLFLMVACMLLVILYLKRGSTPGTTTMIGTNTVIREEEKPPKPPAILPPEVAELRALLDFIPKTPGFSCEELFTGTPADIYNMTSMFHNMEKEYWDVAKRHGRLPIEEYRSLHYAVGQKFVKNVCETGFNAGCSSFYHLTASNQTTVQSFELGGKLYHEHVAKWMSSNFGSRFSIHLGDSTKTVPEYARQNPDFRCDFMYVDGGHIYSVAREDMINFSNMANLKHNFIAFDDYPPGWKNFGKAWEDSLSDGTVQELMRCSYKAENFDSPRRGFVIGVVVKHPNGSDR